MRERERLRKEVRSRVEGAEGEGEGRYGQEGERRYGQEGEGRYSQEGEAKYGEEGMRERKSMVRRE